MTINLQNRPSDLEEKLKSLAPWGHYFKFDDKTITGFFSKDVASEEEVVKDPNLTFCTKDDSQDKIDKFNVAYEKMITNSTRQFMLIDILKKIMGSDYLEATAYDFGCNDGMKSFYLKQSGVKKVVGYEYRKECIDRANYIKEVSNTKNIEFICHEVSADIPEYIIGIEPADIVSSFGILHHLKDHKQHIKNLRAVTKRVLLLHSAFYDLKSNNAIEVQEKNNTFKSIDGESIIPTYNGILNDLYDVGFSHVMRVEYNKSMGDPSFMKSLNYWIAIV